jgi:hypothetical protein
MVPNPTSTKWSVKCSWWTKKECAGCVLRRIFPTCTSNLLLPCNVALTIQPKYMWDMYENTFCCLPFLVTFTFTYKNTLAFYSTAAIFRSSYKPHREDHPSIHSPTTSKREREEDDLLQMLQRLRTRLPIYYEFMADCGHRVRSSHISFALTMTFFFSQCTTTSI